MRPIQQDLVILQGATFSNLMQWRSAMAVHKAISSVQIGLPTLITVTAHGLTGAARQPVWITNVKGPRELNTEGYRGCHPRWATVVDVDTLAIDMDTGSLTPFQASPAACLTYYPPVDLTDYTAVMQVRASASNENVLLELSTENSGITLDPETGSITLLATPEQTVSLEWQQGVYDLLLTSGEGFATRLSEGNITVKPDVTRA